MARYRSRLPAHGGGSSRRGRGGVSPVVVGLVLVLVAAIGAVGYLLYTRSDTRRNEGAGACPDPSRPVTIALGGRANSPNPILPAELRTLVDTAVEHRQRILVYRIDGQPTVAVDKTFHPTVQAGGPLQQQTQEFEDSMVAAIGQVRSVQPEADPLRALWLAARATPVGGTVVLFDSGLQTVAPLDFRQPGLLEAKPEDVAAKLGVNETPDLSGRSVYLMGIGDTASPQRPLSQNQHDNVVAIWQAIAGAGGAACVNPLTDPPVDAAARITDPRVSSVPVPTLPALVACGETKLSDSTLGFVADEPTLRDPDAAKAYLSRYVPDIQAKHEHVLLIGTTARWGTRKGQEGLSTQRAETIKGLLTQLGVPATSISTKGVGSYSTYYQPDGGPNGPLNPAVAARNRSVIVQLTCPASP
jgi:outer membrane protein OmpA-like peptidoglycan-associated protein